MSSPRTKKVASSRGKASGKGHDSTPSASGPSRHARLLSRLGLRLRIGLTVVLILVALGYFQRQAIEGALLRASQFLGLGLPALALWAVVYLYSFQRWRVRTLKQTHRWAALLSIGTSALALSSLLSLEGAVGTFPLTTGLGSLFVKGGLVQGAANILLLLALSGILIAPRSSLRAIRWAVSRIAVLGILALLRSAILIWRTAQRRKARRLARESPLPDGALMATDADQEEPLDIDAEAGGMVLSESEEEESQSPIPIIRTGREIKPQQEAQEEEVSPPLGGWRLPPLDLLEYDDWESTDDNQHFKQAALIQQTLADHGIEAEVVEIRPGPTVTQYGVRPGWQRRYRDILQRDASGQTVLDEEGRPVIQRQEVSRTRVKVDRISALEKDLSLNLEAVIRVEAPVPGTGIVGIEVPNPSPQVVAHRAVLESAAFRKTAEKTKLAIPIGVRPGGDYVVGDLTRMPHLLIGGATGSGKSVFISAILTALLLHATPDEIKLLLVDPKRVELTRYDNLPHLLSPVLINPDDVVNALKWGLVQMEERLEVLANAGSRDIQSYNKNHGEKFPYIIFVIDELADLMMTSGKAVERGITRLAQMGRATGIHLIVATQRPSVDVVTGLIKANFPTRVSFAVSSAVDSRTILDIGGAEKLLGRGDLFYHSQDASRPIRVQGALVTEEETRRIADYWRTQSGGHKVSPLPDMSDDEIDPQQRSTSGLLRRTDPLLQQGRDLATVYGSKLSISLLQRKLGIGYPRAARLKDQLVEEGVVPSDGSAMGR